MLAGLCATVWATFIFKLFLAPPNPDILTKTPLTAMPFLNPEGFYLVISGFFKEITQTRWQYAWLLLFLAAVSDWRKYFRAEMRIFVLFFALYALVLLSVYLTTVHFGLPWRLSRTLPRILFYLLPSVVFTVFCAWGEETNSEKEKTSVI